MGAAQTIDQPGLYGSHARWAVDMPLADMPLADGGASLERFARGVATRAAEVAAGPPAGPVHLNFPFREPLVEPGSERLSPPAVGSRVATPPAPRAPSAETAAELASAFAGRRGLIVCGPESGGLPAGEIAALAAALGWPLLADPLSGVRAGRHDLGQVVETYDTLLRDPQFAAGAAPEVVLRFGAAPTSKALNGWLATQADAPQYVVDEAGGWRDPDAMAAAMVRAQPAALCAALLGRIEPAHHADRAARADAAWPARWLGRQPRRPRRAARGHGCAGRAV